MPETAAPPAPDRDLKRVRRGYEDLREELRNTDATRSLTRRRGILTQAGATVEGFGKLFLDRHGPPRSGDRRLDDVLQQLRPFVPKNVFIELDYVRHWRNLGAHDNPDFESVDDAALPRVQAALHQFVAWFYNTYVGVPYAEAAPGGARSSEPAALADLSVSEAVDQAVRIAGKTGLSLKTVRKRLGEAAGGTRLASVFPALCEPGPPGLEDLGGTPVSALRAADSFVAWLANNVGLSVKVVRSRLGKAHGLTHVRNALDAPWPAQLGEHASLRRMLANLPASAALEVDVFVRWIAWFAEVPAEQARTRLERGDDAPVGEVVPTLSG